MEGALLRPTAEETKRRWQKLESDLAERLLGWKTVASGSKSDKGDAKSYSFLGECKYRWAWDAHLLWYIPLDLQWLETIWRYAEQRKKVPLLALEWGDGTRGCMMPSHHYHQYVGSNLCDDSEDPGRIIRVPAMMAECGISYHFENIEVPQQKWALFPWSDLSWLRIEELSERKKLGEKQRSSLPVSKTKWQKRSFPTRPKS